MKTSNPANVARRLASQMWGPIHKQRKVGPGVWTFSTAGHGGYVVDTDVRSQFRGSEITVYTCAGGCMYRPSEQHFAAFEEDCEYAKVDWLCPDIFTRLAKLYRFECTFDAWVEQRLASACDSLECWNPDWLHEHPKHGPLQYQNMSKKP